MTVWSTHTRCPPAIMRPLWSDNVGWWLAFHDELLEWRDEAVVKKEEALTDLPG